MTTTAKELEIESADPNAALSSKELLASDTYWEMQEEAERDAAEQMQQARQNRRGHFIGLDW